MAAQITPPFTLKWGILATGSIAETFCRDLLCDPAVRDVHDVRHEIAAVASSTSVSRAASFLKSVGGPPTAKTYCSYSALVADPDVDIVYVATPHSHHFQNAMLALEAGKNVLCEKPLTVTAAQARRLVDRAREKGLFLMEAVWTRFFPLSIKIRELIAAGAIGQVHRTIADGSCHLLADLSFADAQDDGSVKWKDAHRMVNPDLAGGVLLDLGVYSLTWVFQTLYHVQKEKERPAVSAAVDQYRTGVDESTSVICHFPANRMTGIATASIRVGTDPNNGLETAGPAIRIQGTKGEIQVAGPAYRPTQYRVIRKDDARVDVVDCPVPKDGRVAFGWGMFWEADECARCLREGRMESATMPLEESVVIMETMETALKQGRVTYPRAISSDVYDAKSPLNAGKR